MNQPDKITYCYDRHIKSWCIQLKDAEDNQIDKAIYVYSKPEVLKEIEDLKTEYNISKVVKL